MDFLNDVTCEKDRSDIIMPAIWYDNLELGRYPGRNFHWTDLTDAGVMDVFFECCVVSGRDRCVGLITPPEEAYRVLCVCVISKPQQRSGLGPSGLLSHESKSV
jgi:hypothetical protein